MSSLVLTRKAGQSIRFELKPGLFLLAQFETVSFNNGCQIRFSHGGLEQVTVVRVGGSTEITIGLRVGIAAVKFGQAKVLIDAPREVGIERTERLPTAESS